MSRFLSSAPLSCLRREDLRKVENWRSRICKNSVSRKTALIMLRLPDENFDRESRSRRNIPVECVLHGLKILLLFQLQKPLQSPVCAPPPGSSVRRRGCRNSSAKHPRPLPPDLPPRGSPGQREVYEKSPENRPAIDVPSPERERIHLYRKI